MNKGEIDLRGIAHIAVPILVGEFLEEALIVTDSILLSYKPSIYLASVGIIDSILLIVLAYGVALNDSYQNYFARYGKNNLRKIIPVFKKSCKSFLFSGVGVTIILLLLSSVFLRIIHTNDIIKSANQSLWLIFPVGVLSYLSMWLNSFLIGLKHYKFLAFVSIICILINGILGYLLLFVIDIQVNPTSVVLITSSISEVLAIILMWIYVFSKYSPYKVPFQLRHSKQMSKIFYCASIYPALSEVLFHVGSFMLFLFCSFFFPQNQIALLTLIFSYWGLLQVPVDGIQEIALNYFAEIHIRKDKKLFPFYSNSLIKFSRLLCGLMFLIISVIEIFVETRSAYKLGSLIIVFFISLLACETEIFNTSLIARLKNDKYIISKSIFGVIAVSLILMGRFLFNIDNIYVILIPFLFAQLCENIYASNTAKKLWNKTA